LASPVSYVDAKDPPFLLIHGTEDQVVPIAQSRLGEARLRAAGVAVQTIYIPGVDHSFIGTTPAQTRAATLQATNATFDFFHARLGVPKR
jgi:dipeptidyl aminopeptidase/acylaminoacyl peptidase